MPRDHVLEGGSAPQGAAGTGRSVWIPLALGAALFICSIAVGFGSVLFCEHSACTSGDATPEAVCHTRLDVRRGNTTRAAPAEEFQACVEEERSADRLQTFARPAGVGAAAALLGALWTTILRRRRAAA